MSVVLKEAGALGLHLGKAAEIVGAPLIAPARPPEEDPEYGLTRYLTFPERGFNILVDWDDVVECLQFYGARNGEDYAEYAGTLPHGLTFRSTRAEVRAALGQPQQQNDGGVGMRPWDWFVHDGRKLHFEYHASGPGVRLVSAMPLP